MTGEPEGRRSRDRSEAGPLPLARGGHVVRPLVRSGWNSTPRPTSRCRPGEAAARKIQVPPSSIATADSPVPMTPAAVSRPTSARATRLADMATADEQNGRSGQQHEEQRGERVLADTAGPDPCACGQQPAPPAREPAPTRARRVIQGRIAIICSVAGDGSSLLVADLKDAPRTATSSAHRRSRDRPNGCSSTTSAEALPCLHRTADFRRTQIAEPPWYVGSSEGGPARCCAMVLRMTGPPNDGLRGAAAPQRAPAGTDGGARRQSVEFRRLRHIGRSRSGRPSRTSPRTAPAMMEGAPGGRGDVGRRGVWGFRLCTSEGGGRGVTG